jgi:hypothetical protein
MAQPGADAIGEQRDSFSSQVDRTRVANRINGAMKTVKCSASHAHANHLTAHPGLHREIQSADPVENHPTRHKSVTARPPDSLIYACQTNSF